MSEPQIERYFDEACLIPALKGLGQSRQAEARSDLFPHHENYIEISLVLYGTLHWWVEDETHTLYPDSVYITHPGEVHGSVQNLVQPCTLTWLQVDPKALSDMPMPMTDGKKSALAHELMTLEQRTWRGAGELMPFVTAMLQELREPQNDSPRLLAAYLHVFIVEFLRQYSQRDQRPVRPERLKQMLTFIDEHLLSPEVLNVETLAKHINLSRSRVFQLFDQHLGLSPMSYVKQRRLELAKQELRRTQRPITDIALDLGYCSSQHFATQFKKQLGMTPREYRVGVSQKIDPTQKAQGRHHQRGYRSVS